MITYTRITFEEAKNMLDEGGCIMFDVRTDEEFFTGHAEGAVNFDVDTINAESAAELIPNKDTPIIVYCKTGEPSLPPKHCASSATQTFTTSAVSSNGRTACHLNKHIKSFLFSRKLFHIRMVRRILIQKTFYLQKAATLF